MGTGAPKPKNTLGMWHILIGEYAPSLHHVFDAFHHVFTIKIPAANTHFFQNTPQKRP
jgi:hypothetical protein